MRGRIRLYSGLILGFFLLTHFLNNTLGLISMEAMDRGFHILMAPWNNTPGLLLLLFAFIFHIGNALYVIFLRTSLRMSHWEAAQLSLGLTIPVLLAGHVTIMLVAQILYKFDTTYIGIITQYWIVMPAWGVVQGIGMIVAWTHGCIGIHYWLRLCSDYARLVPVLMALAVIIPTFGFAGYISAGFKVLARAANEPGFVPMALGTQKMTPEVAQLVDDWMLISPAIAIATLSIPFILRYLRRELWRLHNFAELSLPNGKTFKINRGATILETLRDNNVPHASVCGGRGRCTTCRVHVMRGINELHPPDGVEAKALARLGAPDAVRLACQVRPTTDIAVAPLVASRISPTKSNQTGGIDGQELTVTVMFIDLRGSTKLADSKLPYDVLFILNQFFAEMNSALQITNGHYSNFTGDGLMAIYGLDGKDPARGVKDAIRGADEMLKRVESLNKSLSADLPFPLEIGIGINFGETIVGSMGPPNAQVISAMGDVVNCAARLEALCKDFAKPMILSKSAADAAGIDLPPSSLHSVALRGRAGETEFYTLDRVPEV